MQKIITVTILLVSLACFSQALQLSQHDHLLDISPVLNGISSLFTGGNSSPFNETGETSPQSQQNSLNDSNTAYTTKSSNNNDNSVSEEDKKQPSRSSLEVVELPISDPEIQNVANIYDPAVSASDPISQPVESKKVDQQQNKEQEQKLMKQLNRIKDEKLIKLLMQNTRSKIDQKG